MYQNGSQMKPHFELSYSTKDEYGLQDLTPQSWADLVERYGANGRIPRPIIYLQAWVWSHAII